MSVHDEVEIEDMDFDLDLMTFYYNCPCGDKFQITLEQIKQGKDIAECPSCSLRIRVIYDETTYAEFKKYCPQIQELKA